MTIALDPPYRYPPVNQCIYCGKTADQVELTDEHIIPLSLGGTRVLPKASCKKCAAATSRVELHVAKGMWDYARVQLSLPSRRPKERPQFFELEMPSQTVQQIPIPDLPSTIVSFRFPPAGILFNLPVNTRVGGQVVISHRSAAEADRKMREVSRQGKLRLNPKAFGAVAFAQFLAKIAHSYAVAELGLGGFASMLGPVILERNPEHILHWVGSGTLDEPAGKVLHEIGMARQKQYLGSSRDLWIVRLRPRRHYHHHATVARRRSCRPCPRAGALGSRAVSGDRRGR